MGRCRFSLLVIGVFWCCYLYGVFSQSCLTDVDGCDPPVPCTPGDLVAYPPDCYLFQTCISSYQWLLDETDLCASKGPFSNLTCQCNGLIPCDQRECPPTTGTQLPPIDSVPCAPNLTHCDPSNEGETVYDRFYCTSYFRCASSLWVKELCPEDIPYYYPESTTGNICVNNPARCAETTECEFTLPYVSITEQFTTMVPSTQHPTSSVNLVTTEVASTVPDTTPKYTQKDTTSDVTPQQESTFDLVDTTLQLDYTSSESAVTISTAETTFAEELRTTLHTTILAVSTEVSMSPTSSAFETESTVISTKGNTDQTSHSRSLPDGTISTGSMPTDRSAKPSTTTMPSVTASKGIPESHPSSTVTVTSTTPYATSHAGASIQANQTETTLSTEITSVSSTLGNTLSTTTTSVSSTVETTVLSTQQYDTCTPLPVDCTAGHREPHPSDCGLYYECMAEGYWQQKSCEQANSKKPHFSTWKRKCQKEFLVDCSERCNAEGMEVQKRNIIIASACVGGGVIIIAILVVCCTRNDDKIYITSEKHERLEDKPLPALGEKTSDTDVHLDVKSYTDHREEPLNIDLFPHDGEEKDDSLYISSGQLFRSGNDAGSMVMANQIYLRSLSSGPRFNDFNVIDV